MSYFFSKTTTLFDDLTLISNATNDNRHPFVRSLVDTVKTDVVSRLQKHAAVYKERKITITMIDLFADGENKTPLGKVFESTMAGLFPSTPTKTELKFYGDTLVGFFRSEGIGSCYDSKLDQIIIDWTFNINASIKETVIIPTSVDPQ